MSGRIMSNHFILEIKMTLKVCLTIGIIFSIISCAKTDYVNESEWIYINNTNKTIEITYGDRVKFISSDTKLPFYSITR